MIGRTLGHYCVIEKLGEGGMGVVYLAEDTALGRRAALKLLPDKVGGDPERLQRFLTEARLASSINHPNIVAVYEFGEDQGQRFIAMEYVAGRSLRALLAGGALPLKRLLEIAVPAAEALARAHRAGVLHRDIKPENVLISDDGYVKVADFGLAKLRPNDTPDTARTDEFLTAPGSVMGTAAYMSPEQLNGGECDARGDVFSFGVMLYELATGKSPFLRESTAATTAAILRDAVPPLRTPAGDAPAELERIVAKALEKEAEYRYQSMDDLAADLRRLRRDLDSGRVTGRVEAAPPAAARRGTWKLQAVIGALAIVALAALAWLGARLLTRPAEPLPTRVVQFTALPGLETAPTWSPDGRSLAYVSDEAGQLDIYVQQVSGGGRAIRLTDSDADDAQPAWSPDGNTIAFVSARAHPGKRLSTMLNLGPLQPFFAGRNGDIWIMPALGGATRRIAEDAYYPAWSPDGKSLVYQAMRNDRWGLWVSAVDSLAARQLLAASRPGETAGPTVVTHPAWSPDGKWIAYCAGSTTGLRVFVMSSSGGDPTASTPQEASALMPSWSADGKWLYFSSDRGGAMNLWRARFDGSTLSDYVQVTSGAGADIEGRPDPSDRRIAYSSVRTALDLWQFDLATQQASQLTLETTQEDNGSPSPDGRWLAFLSDRQGGFRLWLMNLTDRSMTPVFNEVLLAETARWSEDSKRLYFVTSTALWQYDLATSVARKLRDVSLSGGRFTITPDERFVIGPLKQQGFQRLELATGNIQSLVESDVSVADPVCSPEGQWVAYYQQQGNRRKIWAVPLAGGAPRQVTGGEGEDSHPSFSPDERSIYFVRNHQDIFIVPFAPGESESATETDSTASARNPISPAPEPRPITNYHSFSIVLDYPTLTRDGKKIIFTRNDKRGDIFLLEPTKQ